MKVNQLNTLPTAIRAQIFGHLLIPSDAGDVVDNIDANASLVISFARKWTDRPLMYRLLCQSHCFKPLKDIDSITTARVSSTSDNFQSIETNHGEEDWQRVYMDNCKLLNNWHTGKHTLHSLTADIDANGVPQHVFMSLGRNSAIASTKDATAHQYTSIRKDRIGAGEDRVYVMEGHSSLITATLLEGSIIFTADLQRRIKIWMTVEHAQSTRNVCLGEVRATHEVNVLQYEMGKWIGSVGEDGCICLWMLQRIVGNSTEQISNDTSNIKALPDMIIKAHTKPITCFQLKYPFMVTGSIDHTISIRIYCASSKSVKNVMQLEHSSPVYSLQFNNNLLISGCEDGTARLWDIKRQPILLKKWKAHNGGIVCLQFDSKRLITGSADGTIRSWTLHSILQSALSMSITGYRCSDDGSEIKPSWTMNEGGIIWRIYFDKYGMVTSALSGTLSVRRFTD